LSGFIFVQNIIKLSEAVGNWQRK